MMKSLHSPDELDAAIAESHERPVVLYKHSATCPFAARAQEQVAEAKHDVTIYGVVVQYARELSERIAERTGVEHASPQAIVLRDGNVVWTGWRDEIQREKLVELAGSEQVG